MTRRDGGGSPPGTGWSWRVLQPLAEHEGPGLRQGWAQARINAATALMQQGGDKATADALAITDGNAMGGEGCHGFSRDGVPVALPLGQVLGERRLDGGVLGQVAAAAGLVERSEEVRQG